MIKCIGVGPGDTRYLTRYGAELISQADVIAGFEAVIKVISTFIKPEAEIYKLTYTNQSDLLKEVAGKHHSGKSCAVVFMGDLHFSGFQLLDRVEEACGHRVESIPGISSAQILAARGRVCFDDTTFVTFHVRGDISAYKEHLSMSLKNNRNAIVIPRPWDFMPSDIAAHLINSGVNANHILEVYEHLTDEEKSWRGRLADCPKNFSDMSIMLIRKLAYGSVNRNDYHLVLAGHGSRDEDGIAEFESLVQLLQKRYPERSINYGFLEFKKPSIIEAVKESIKAGAKKIVVVPALLTAATHAKNDMPSQLNELRKEFQQTEIHFAAAMDLHPLLLELCQRRIIEAEGQAKNTLKRSQSCLVVVGRGTSDSDANSEIAKAASMLAEGMGFANYFVCYAGTAKPLVTDGLKTAARMGHKRLIVLPYFLFDGILIKRIYKAVDDIEKRFPELEFLKAQYLGIHENVADVFIERADEGINGRNHMNCSLCKYRNEIVGYEEQVGLPQKEHFLLNEIINKQVDFIDQNKIKAKFEEHPIAQESFKIIEAGFDWSKYGEEEKAILQRLVHTTGDFDVIKDVFISPGAIDIGVRAIQRCRNIITDVSMVKSGLNRNLIADLGVNTWCGVHDKETYLLAENIGITRSAAGIRRAWEKWGNEVILAIGDAPTALLEAIKLIKETNWRPQLIIGLPVGFVGTAEAKEELKRCIHVPRITNSGTRGGSNWAAAVTNALLIMAKNRELARREELAVSERAR